MLRAPDAEGACIAALAAAGLSARDRLVAPWPALAVQRVGGTRSTIADAALIQVDCANDLGSSKSATLARLEAAIAALRDAEGESHGGAVIAAVLISQGPAYLPDRDTGAPRYVATLSVVSRALVPQGP